MSAERICAVCSEPALTMKNMLVGRELTFLCCRDCARRATLRLVPDPEPVAAELARLAETVAYAREINPAFLVTELRRIEALARKERTA